jgi:exodeoxyribonuclease VII small subunit
MAAKPKKASRRRASKPEAEASKQVEPAPLSAEALLGRLDEVVRELEGGELPLEQALARFEEGVKLVRDGEQLLASVEQRIEMLLADGRVVPFADDEDYDDEEAEEP